MFPYAKTAVTTLGFAVILCTLCVGTNFALNTVIQKPDFKPRANTDMQNVLIEKPYAFVPRIKNIWAQSLYARTPFYRRKLNKLQGVNSHECRNLHLLKESIDAGHGVIITPNHPRMADPMILLHLARETPCNFYCMASWHLFNQGWPTRMAIRLMGAFSVNREGLDRKAVEHAIEILDTAERPLVIFPEGTTSRTNDRLMSLMDGPSFIARNAAKRTAKKNPENKVVVHPVGIKYVYTGDIQRTCDEVLTRLEHKLTWRSQKDMPLIDRIVKLGNGMLTLKEIEHGITNHQGTLRERQSRMVNHLLHPLEKEWLKGEQEGGIATRIKNLRVQIFPEMSRNELAPIERKRRWKQLEETYLAQQIDCYPDQYVTEHPSVDRILETIEKFEEDLTDNCTIHGNLKAIIDVGEAIEVSPKRERGQSSDPLTDTIRDRLETKLSQLQSESAMYVS